ncbi:MAG: tryptophan synthase subunit alpha [Verrucomicrobia bacterium]|nr:tryptophan synthase subunit alpha [Verrucomicrobiota bacterium]
MNRIDQCFEKLRAAEKCGFIAYISAGDPDLARTRDIVLELERCGVDIVELGLPFSDPLADGIVNQLAADRALRAGTTTPKVIDFIRELRRETQIPLVLFTYLNPVYTYGFERFHQDAAAAGADGVLILDLPPDEASQNKELIESAGLKHIRLIAPTTPESRIELIAAQSEGFIYYVSREGVTGAQTSLSTGIAAQVALIKSHTATPVAVGFGISTPEQASAVAGMADAVVVGSAIVKLIGQHGASPDLSARLAAFVKPLVDAVKFI